MNRFSNRYIWVYACLLGWSVYIIVHMFSLVIRKGDAYRGDFKDTVTVGDRYFQLFSDSKQGFRGNVYSDEEELLSTTIPIYDLYWEISKVGVTEEDSAFFMSRVDSLISIFCQLTPKVSREGYETRIKQAYVDYYQRYHRASMKIKVKKDDFLNEEGRREKAALEASVKNKYELIKISVDEVPSRWVRRSDWDKIRFLFTRKEGEPEHRYYGGCRVDERYVHHNVYNDYAASVIGSMQDQHRYNGLEGYYDSLLSGESRTFRKLYVNRVLVPLRENQLMQVQNGCDVHTTINVELQRLVEQSLRSQLENLQAQWGCAILMEVKTGEIKAISNLTRVNGSYKDIADHAITESYEPGSTFKLISLMAALDSRKVDILDTVRCEKGRFTLKRAFEISDNDGIYEATHNAYKLLNQFFMKIHLMGLDSNLELEVVRAARPQLMGSKTSDIDYHSITHGYAVKIPPIYMLSFYNAVANEGRYVRPYLVKEVVYPDGKKVTNHTEVIKDRICSMSTLLKTRECLEGVVTSGTARRAQDAYYKRANDSTVRPLIAGKTGTAQIYSKGAGYQSNFNASFIGYFPSDHPKYTCLVLISGTHADAGVVSAPVCREIAEKIVCRDLSLQNYKYRDAYWRKIPSVHLGYSSDLVRIYHQLGYVMKNPELGTWVGVCPVNGKDSLVKVVHPNPKDLYHYLIGASAKDAVFLLEKKGYSVQLSGAGRVSDIEFNGKKAKVVLKNESK